MHEERVIVRIDLTILGGTEGKTRNMLEKRDIKYQIAELGKVDIGGEVIAFVW